MFLSIVDNWYFSDTGYILDDIFIPVFKMFKIVFKILTVRGQKTELNKHILIKKIYIKTIVGRKEE